MDLSFGRGKDSPGGILIRAICPIVAPDKKQYIEGPCNTVNKILSLNSTPGKPELKEVIELVSLPDMILDVFDTKSRLHLVPSESVPHRDLY